MYITSPKTHRKIFLNNGISSYEQRLHEVKERLLEDEEILSYCQENNRIKNNSQETSYRKTERILENAATYLLLGQYEKNGIMTIYQIRQAAEKEIVASNSDSNAEGLLYSDVGGGAEGASLTASTGLKHSETEKDFHYKTVKDIERSEKKRKKQTKRYKDTKSYRFEKLICTPEVHTYRIKPLKEKDENGKEKVVKNVFGQPIHDFEYVTIGGNKGDIDKNRPHVVKWCTVDTDNCFEFNGHTFRISEKLKQYQVDKDNQSEMDKILCYFFKDEIEYLFFDMNIEDIDDYVVQTH